MFYFLVRNRYPAAATAITPIAAMIYHSDRPLVVVCWVGRGVVVIVGVGVCVGVGVVPDGGGDDDGKDVGVGVCVVSLYISVMLIVSCTVGVELVTICWIVDVLPPSFVSPG